MAEAFVKFVDQADIDISGNQHLFYNITFAGADVPEEIAKGTQNQLEIVKEPTWNYTRVRSEVVRLTLARAGELGLTVASADILNASYNIERPIHGDCFLRIGVTQKAPHASTLTEQIGILSSLSIVGTVVSITDNVDGGQYNKYTSPVTAGSPAGWKNNAFIGSKALDRGHHYFSFKTDTNITNCRIWIEYSTSYIGNVDTPTIETLAFRFSTVAGDTNWMLVSVNPAITVDILDSGVPVLADTRYEFEIDSSVANQASFYIDKLFVGTATVIPTSTCCVSMTVNPTTNSARAILLSKMIGQYK